MRAYERFLKYVTIYTTSDEESTSHPSTARQFDLAHLLVEQLKELGVADAAVDEKCYVYGTLPATPGYEEKPALGFVSHMDTAPAAPGENVKPQVFENYDGGDVLFAGTGEYMTVEKFPELANWKGQTLITADGTTLLGADDKAGIAEIMTAVERIQKENIPHGKLCIGFTPDEEVGQGADFFDVDRFGAQFAYTVDGGTVEFAGQDITDLSPDKRSRAGLFLSFQAPVEIPGVPLSSFLRATRAPASSRASSSASTCARWPTSWTWTRPTSTASWAWASRAARRRSSRCCNCCCCAPSWPSSTRRTRVSTWTRSAWCRAA